MVKYLFLLLYLFGTLHANTLILDDRHLSINDFRFSYLKDEHSTYTIADIQHQKFLGNSSNAFALGYTKGTLWIKIDVRNISDHENFVLSLGEHFYEKANLYYLKDHQYIQKHNGLFVPVSQREIYANQLLYKLTIPKNTTQSLYLELQGKYAYFGYITLTKEKDFHPYTLLNINTVYLLLLGITAIIMILNLFLYFKVKERVYAYYVGYGFFNLIYIINISGLLVYLNLQHYIYKLQFTASFMMGFLILFSIEILEMKRYLPRIGKVAPYFSLPAFFFGIMILFTYQPWNKLINDYAGLGSLILIVLSIIIYLEGHKKIKYYIFAMVTFFAFVILFTFMVAGVFEYSFGTRYGYVFASVIEIIVFSLILSNRYYDMREDFIRSQSELIEIKSKNEAFLENEVRNRTEQLENLLGEREMLVKEVHHRVKNNFHTLIGLLWLEEQNGASDENKFQNLRNRIKSMSMIHEKLYQSKDINNIPIKEYIEEIIANLLSAQKVVHVQLHQDIKDTIFKFDYVVSLGIIVNEIISNTLKHNQGTKNLAIEVNFTYEGGIATLIIKDNGKGFERENVTEGLGMNIIQSFSKKLPNSTWHFDTNDGVVFTLRFQTGEFDG
ncbi:MAG: hypothetical protein CJD30_08620 [Sulfuricurvum sp. PD_MW2]|jgi:two-component sensor histidine kinase|uniref:7TM diverse intracellular signaling domain-containing protein n=1 Tax=Sulfuricurvum sp. PD_MW2 TaxID=2027917 RepID=UPI000C065B38|nr:7TM diverse intracellular signaling domain-containing protein [Sulfuricurvum sp. PD_MW2]PHM17058.1 MAG: hypothetical protein CJD30_08620 [Sulfuricurvum sp. PD_MW2]